MTPESVYGLHSVHIKESGDCWLWTGSLRGKTKVPQLVLKTPPYRYMRTMTYATTALEMEPFPRIYRMACLQPTCVHPEHAVDDLSEVGRMVFIAENSVAVGDCHEWLGKLNKGNPEIVVHNGRMSVRKHIWCTEHVPAGSPWPDDYYVTSCKNSLCVRVSHVVRKFTHTNDTVPA